PDSGRTSGDLARRRTFRVCFPDEAAGPGRLRKGDTLTDPGGEQRRVVIGERERGLARDDSASGASIEDEAGDELGAIDARLAQQREHLGRSPAVEGRRLHRDQDDVGREQRRAHEPGDAGRTVDDDVIGIARKLGRFAMKRVARQADDAEQARQALAGALLRPVESGTLRVGIDDGDTLAASRPLTGEVEGERRLADAALLVEQRDDHGAASRWRHSSTGVERGAAVRKIPKESWLEELRRAHCFELTLGFDESGPRWHEDRVPDGTIGRVPDSTTQFTAYPQRARSRAAAAERGPRERRERMRDVLG